MNNSSLPSELNRSKPFTRTDGGGHRARLRKRLLELGAESLQDYEILEMLLFFVIRRRDTKPLAKSLINQFGSLQGVLDAKKEYLNKAGLSEKTIELLYFPEKIAQSLVKKDHYHRPFLGDWINLNIYLDSISQPVSTECLRVLYLNTQKYLIDDKIYTHQNISVIINQALKNYAVYAIVVRYYSKEMDEVKKELELEFYHALNEAAQPFDLNIIDYIIKNKQNYYTLLNQKGYED